MSAYTYAYATLGEIVAWIIGWDLILEYGVSVAAVAVGWGGNFNVFLHEAFGFRIPDALSTAREEGRNPESAGRVHRAGRDAAAGPGRQGERTGQHDHGGGQAGRAGRFIIVAFANFKSGNLHPFNPHGRDGVVTAASIVFFAFIGFDAISTGSEETKNPGRSLPIAIIGALGIATFLYVLTSLGAVGLLPADQLSKSDAPLATALQKGAGISWAAAVLAFGALVSITSVILAVYYGQTRIFFSMARDGLMPTRLAKVHPRTGAPVLITVAFGVLIAILAAVAPLGQIVELVNIGTLFAFVLVNIGVIVLRRTRPEMERPFKVPLVPFVPILGLLFTFYLMSKLPALTWVRFVVWLLLGLVIYALYGYKHSRLRHGGTYSE